MKEQDLKKYIKVCQKSGCVSASYHSGENEEAIYFLNEELRTSGKFNKTELNLRKTKEHS